MSSISVTSRQAGRRADVAAPCIVVRRIYERDPPSTGRRVLVDRLWPRGVSKTEAALDEWAKDVAPSDELRRWYGHDPQLFDKFARRYRRELRHSPCADIVANLLEIARQDGITLLTATRDVEHSGARVLQRHMLADLERMKKKPS
ncbi:MAG: DUF488 family protein [Ilumatobacteraceae bacterium]